MAKIAGIVKWRDTSGGIITNVSRGIKIPNTVPFAMNMRFDDEIGIAVSREGTTIIGATLSSGNPCLGLHNFRDSVGTNNKLFAAFNGTIFNTETGTAEETGLNTTAQHRFVTFLDTVLMMNGAENRSTIGNGTWVSSGGNLDVNNVPAGSQFPIEWHDRIYAAVVDRLNFTSTPSSGTVSWTGSGSGNIQIEREDGGGTITATSKVPGYLLIFKERSLKRWNFDSTFPDDLVSLGTQSQESVTIGRGMTFFFYGPKGFYAPNGGFPTRISKPIQRIVDAIPSSFFASVNGWCDEEHVYWSVGDLTITFRNGLTESHNNVVVRYTIDTQEWSVYKYADEYRAFSRFVSGTDVLLAAGTANGDVHQLNTGNTDHNGQAITYILESPEFDFDREANTKIISDRIIIHSEQANGAELQVKIDRGNYKSIGNVDGDVTSVGIQSLSGHIFQFRLTDSITGEQVKLRGLDFPSIEINESYK